MTTVAAVATPAVATPTVSAAATVSAAVPASVRACSAPARLIEDRCPQSSGAGPAKRATATTEGSVAA